MTNDRIGMIYNFFYFFLKKLKKKKKNYDNSMTNDLIEMICNFFKEKFFFSYRSRFSGFLFSRYDDVAEIRFCARFLFSRYDDVAQCEYLRRILILEI